MKTLQKTSLTLTLALEIVSLEPSSSRSRVFWQYKSPAETLWGPTEQLVSKHLIILVCTLHIHQGHLILSQRCTVRNTENFKNLHSHSCIDGMICKIQRKMIALK